MTAAPKMYTYRSYAGAEPGPCHNDGCCVRCGRPLVDVVQLEFDQRYGEYHDDGDIPVDMSQGWFDFGPDCAKALRARAKLAKATVLLS